MVCSETKLIPPAALGLGMAEYRPGLLFWEGWAEGSQLSITWKDSGGLRPRDRSKGRESRVARGSGMSRAAEEGGWAVRKEWRILWLLLLQWSNTLWGDHRPTPSRISGFNLDIRIGIRTVSALLEYWHRITAPFSLWSLGLTNF